MTTPSDLQTPSAPADPSQSVTPPPARFAADHLQQLQATIAPLYRRLAEHPLYRSIRSLQHLQLFMQSHVFAVWDFMSLLKALQRGLTSVDVPWLPSPLPEARRLINEIVLGEESDLYQGRAASHFELYREAMHAAGASTSAIDDLLFLLAQNRDAAPDAGASTSLAGAGVESALASVSILDADRAFVRSTFAVIESGHLHRIAAAFTFGREDLIPDLFTAFIRDQNEQLSSRLELFRWYLDRHIEVDGEEHGPMALRMVAELCGADPQKWSEAQAAATTAIEARLALWDALQAQITAA